MYLYSSAYMAIILYYIWSLHSKVSTPASRWRDTGISPYIRNLQPKNYTYTYTFLCDDFPAHNNVHLYEMRSFVLMNVYKNQFHSLEEWKFLVLYKQGYREKGRVAAVYTQN